MRLILFVCLLIAAQIAIAQQPKLENEDVAHPDSLIVFDQYLNHFRLSGVADLSSYGLQLDNGRVSYQGNGTFLVRNLSKSPVVISVFQRTDKDSALSILYTKTYQVQARGIPTVQLIRESDEVLSNQQRVNQTRLEPVFPNSNYAGPSKIAHFELTAVEPDGRKVLDQLFVSEEFLGITVTDKLKILQRGGMLYFTQVVLYTQDGRYERLADFSVKY